MNLLISYTKLGIISGLITLIGVLGIILDSFVPNLAFVFEFLFYLGILGLTLSFYSYALHLYEFNSLVISNLTLSSIIALYLMSFNVITYSTILQLWASGILGWGVIVLYLVLIFAGSWILLFIGESIRIAILSDEHKPKLRKDMPGVSGAFSIMLIVIAFVTVNFLIASGEGSYSALGRVSLTYANNDSGQPNPDDPNNPPLMNLLQDYFATHINPTVAQEENQKEQQQWDAGMALFSDGYSQCFDNSTLVAEMPSMNSNQDKTAICDGISDGASNLRESGVDLSGISGASSFAISKKASQGLLVPIIDQLSDSCEDSVNLCKQAEIAVQNDDNDQFQNNLNEIQSDLRQMKVDYNEGAVFIDENSTQS